MTKKAKIIWSLASVLLIAILGLTLIEGIRGTNNGKHFIEEQIHYFRFGRAIPKFSRCIDNLRRIQLAKTMWAENEKKTTNDVPSWSVLQDYLADQRINGIPTCPDGGNYKLNRIGELPTCSIGDKRHSLQKAPH